MKSIFAPFFSKAVWKDGEQLFHDGKVKLWEKTHAYEAEIQAKAVRHVIFTLSPISMHCDCEEAGKGKHCKHMAAAFHAYEVTLPAYENDRWKGLSYDMDGKTYDVHELMKELHQYLLQPVHRIEHLQEAFCEHLDLLSFLLDLQLYHDTQYPVTMECIKQLSYIRTYVLRDGEAAQLIQKEWMDMSFLYVLDRYPIAQGDEAMLESYFCEQKDDACLFAYLEQVTYDHQMLFAAYTFTKMLANDAPKEQIARLCEQYGEHKAMRTWLIAYLKRSKQYGRGIRFLQEYCFSNAKADEDITKEQLELLLLYTLAQRFAARNAYYQVVLSLHGIRKAELFACLKEAMGEEQWRTCGKQWMLEYMKGKPVSTCLELMEQTHSGDLLFEALLPAYEEADIYRYYHELYSYDAGLLYHMIQSLLDKRLAALTNVHELCHAITCLIPDQGMDKELLKRVVLVLKAKHQKNREAICALELLEDELYEVRK